MPDLNLYIYKSTIPFFLKESYRNSIDISKVLKKDIRFFLSLKSLFISNSDVNQINEYYTLRNRLHAR